METILIKALVGAPVTGVAALAIWVVYKLAKKYRNGTGPGNIHTAITVPKLPILGGTNPVDEISGVIPSPQNQPITIGEHELHCKTIQMQTNNFLLEQVKEIEKAIDRASKETGLQVKEVGNEAYRRIEKVGNEANRRIENVRQEVGELKRDFKAVEKNVAVLSAFSEREQKKSKN